MWKWLYNYYTRRAKTKDCKSVLQIYIHTYKLQSRRFASLLSSWNAKGSAALLPSPRKKVKGQLPSVPAHLAVFEKIYNYRHGVLEVRTFASQSEELGSTIVESD